MLTNPTSAAQRVTLTYRESLSPIRGSGGSLTLDLAPAEQRIVLDAIDCLRRGGVAAGSRGQAFYAGSLLVEFRSGGALSSGFAEARTVAPASGGGRCGLFYPATSLSFSATEEIWIHGLRQYSETRANVAVAAFPEAGEDLTVRLEVFDGETGSAVGDGSVISVSPGEWRQIDGVLRTAGVSNGLVRVKRISGRGRFVSYGVVNDGEFPESGATNDGSFVAMSEYCKREPPSLPAPGRLGSESPLAFRTCQRGCEGLDAASLFLRIYRRRWQTNQSLSRPRPGTGHPPSHSRDLALMNETDRHVLHWPEAGVEMAFRLIPPGEFRMGTRKTEWTDEEPVHTVRITQPFWLGETPVTQEQFDIWKRAEKVEHEHFFEGQAENPAENMSWRDAITYCSWLAKTKRMKLPPGHSFVCLPTEAEWEYACRAGTETAYHTGDGEDDLADAGWFLGNAKSTTHLVGSKKANAFGLHDMHGNVREWCHDGWNEDAYERREDGVRDPASLRRIEEWRTGLSTMLESSLARVLRGGSWGDWAADCRSANRYGRRPFVSGSNVGFRVCLARIQGHAPSA